jgi:hypothetical protein
MMVRGVTTSTLESDALVCKTTDSYQLIHFHKSTILCDRVCQWLASDRWSFLHCHAMSIYGHMVLVLNVTFNNISVLLLGETGVPLTTLMTCPFLAIDERCKFWFKDFVCKQVSNCDRQSNTNIRKKCVFVLQIFENAIHQFPNDQKNKYIFLALILTI